MSDVAGAEVTEMTDELAVAKLLETPEETSEEQNAPEGEQPEPSGEQEVEASEQETDDDPLLEAEPVTETEEDEEALFEVKANGETLRVTLDELTNGYSRQQDYTRKTEDLAREREAIEAERKSIAEQVEAERRQLEAFHHLVQTIGPEPQPPSPDLYNEDPDEYREQKERYEVLKSQWDNAANEVVKTEEKRIEEQKAQIEQYKSAEMQKLQEAWPDLKDPEKANAINVSLTRFLSETGYSSEEIGQIVDSRFLLLARDAYRYRQRGKVVEKKVKNAPKVQKPGASPEKLDANTKVAAFIQKAKSKPGGLSEDDAVNVLLGNVE